LFQENKKHTLEGYTREEDSREEATGEGRKVLEVSKDLHGLLAHQAGGSGYLSDWRNGGNVTPHGTDLLAR
jgi:hypothetical protein